MQLHSIRVLGVFSVAAFAAGCSNNSVPQQDATVQQAPATEQHYSAPSSARDLTQAPPTDLSGTYVSANDNSAAIIRMVDTSGNILREFDLVKFDVELGQSTTQTTQTLNVKGNADGGNIVITLTSPSDDSGINMTGTYIENQVELTFQGKQTTFVRMSPTDLQNALLAIKHRSQAEAVQAEEDGANRDATDSVRDITNELNTFVGRVTADPNFFGSSPEWWSEFEQAPSNQENLFHAHVALTQGLEKLVELDTKIALSPCSNSSLPGCDQYFAAVKKYAEARSNVLTAIEAKRTEWVKYACSGGVANIGMPNTVTPMVDLCAPTVHMPTITALRYGDATDSSNSTATTLTTGEVAGNTAFINVTTEGNGSVVIRFDVDSLVGVERGSGSMMNEATKQTIIVNGTTHTVFNIALPQKGTDGTPRPPYVELPVFMAFAGMGYPNESPFRVGTVFLKEATGLE